MESSKSFISSFHLDGEIAIITGGATDLGFGMARNFVASDAKVVLVGRREHDKAAELVRRDKILGRTPMARLGDADDIGWAAVYLCSPAAKFVTGVVLPVDGGTSIGY